MGRLTSSELGEGTGADRHVQTLWREFTASRAPGARERLACHYACLVQRALGRLELFLPQKCDHGDVVDRGIKALLEAVDNYDPERDGRFEEYALARIEGAIMDGQRSVRAISPMDSWWTDQIRAAMAALTRKLGRAPTDKEVAVGLGIPLEMLLDLYDKGAGSFAPSSGTTKLKESLVSAVARAIDLMPVREKVLLSLYYREGLTLREIAQVLSLSEKEVRRIHNRALIFLASQLEARSPAQEALGQVQSWITESVLWNQWPEGFLQPAE